MARVASTTNENTNLPTPTPFMDRLTHEVIKETSKGLCVLISSKINIISFNEISLFLSVYRRHYLDVKRRENAFVLNPNSTAVDSVPYKAVNNQNKHCSFD